MLARRRARACAVVASLAVAGSLLVSVPAQGAPATDSSGSAPAEPREEAVAQSVDLQAPFVPGEVIVTYEQDATSIERASARRAVADDKPQAEKIAPQVELVQVDPDVGMRTTLKELNAQDGVAYAEPNYILTTTAVSNDPYFRDDSLWGMAGSSSSPASPFGSNAAGAWANGHTGSDKVYVAVLDSGIDTSHPDLQPNMWVNSSEATGAQGVDDDGNGFVDDVHGYDFVYDDG